MWEWPVKCYQKLLQDCEQPVDFVTIPTSSTGNRERYLPLCQSFLMRRNSALSGFSLNDIHDWTEVTHYCKHIQLTIITIEKMRSCMSRNHMTKSSGIKGKEQRTKNWPLWDSQMKIKLRGETITQLYHRTSVSQVRFKSVKCLPGAPNQSSSLLKSIEWSVVSKAVERLSKVGAVTFAIIHRLRDITMDH